jgi:ATP-dependent protease HslVU (ClpYQ) ATPase subunit
MEDLSYTASELPPGSVHVITPEDVRKKVHILTQKSDLSKYIL